MSQGAQVFVDQGHQILSTGSVTPSVRCPHLLCLFEQWLFLEDYGQGASSGQGTEAFAGSG